MQQFNGFIKLHRKLVRWGWYTNYVVKDVFLHCLLSASHKDFEWQGQTIKKGQFVTGRKQLANDLGFSEQQIRSALKKLESTQELTIKTTNKYSIVTVNNWEDYQCSEEKSTNTLTNKEPTNNQQITTKQEYKEINNSNNSYINNAHACACEDIEQTILIASGNAFLIDNLDAEIKQRLYILTQALITHYFSRNVEDADYHKIFSFIHKLTGEVNVTASDVELLTVAFQIAKDNNKLNYGYIGGIVANWHKSNISTIEDYENYKDNIEFGIDN